MRIGLIASALLLSSCASVPVPLKSVPTIQTVHQVQLSKKVIFDRSLEYIARVFNDSKEVLELKDPESGKIVGKGITSFNNGKGWSSSVISCEYKFMIEAKDNRYRTTYESFTGIWGGIRIPIYDERHWQEVAAEAKELDEDLFKFLNKKPDSW